MARRACEAPKMKYKRGLWAPDEDQRLRDYVFSHGLTCWTKVPAKAGLQRNGKSCRLRWINYLRPGLKRGFFSEEEERTVIELQSQVRKWSQIAVHLPGRTDNEVKNHWNSYLKKKIIKAQKSDNIPPASNSSLDCTSHQNPSLQSEDPDKNISSEIHSFPFKALFGDCLSLDQASADCSVDLEQVIRDSFPSSNSELQASGGECLFEDIQEQTEKECIDQIEESTLFDMSFPGVVYEQMDFAKEA